MTKINKTSFLTQEKLLNKALSKIDKSSKSYYLFSNSKKKFIKETRSVKLKIEKQLSNLKKLSKEESTEELKIKRTNLLIASTKLINSLENFKKHCFFGNEDVKTLKDEMSLDFHRLFTPEFMTDLQVEQKKIYEEKEKIATSLPYRIQNIVPANSKLNNESPARLYAIEKELKKLLLLIPETNEELKKLWWVEYSRLLPFIQKIQYDCGTKGTPVKTVELDNERMSTSIFSLVNLGAFDVQNELNSENLMSEKSSSLTYSFTIRLMHQMLKNNEVPDNEKDKFISLLRRYEACYRIESYRMKNDGLGSKQKVVQKIYQELEASGSIRLSTGFKNVPLGHQIALDLYLSETDGKKYIHGEIINRGVGVAYHGEHFYQGLKDRVNPYMQLPAVPLDELKNSQFLELLFELTILKTSAFPSLDITEETNYKAVDFYDIVLPAWPLDEFNDQNQKREVRAGQIGPTCTFKACITSFRDVFTSEFARLIKLKMRIESLEHHFFNGQLNPNNIPFLEWSLTKIHRTIEKIERSSRIVDPIIQEQLKISKKHAILLSEKVNEKIKELQSAEDSFEMAERFDCDFIYSKVADSDEGTDLAKIHNDNNIDDGEVREAEIPMTWNLDLGIESVKQLTQYYDKLLATPGDRAFKTECYKKVIDALPSCTSAFWTDKEVSGVLALILKLSLYRYIREDDKIKASLTGRECANVLNAVVGILVGLNASDYSFEKEYIQDRASRLLGMLETALPNLRTGLLGADETIKLAQDKLKSLANNKAMPLKLIVEGTGFGYQKAPCFKVEDILKDPVTKHFYKKAVPGSDPFKRYPISNDELGVNGEEVLLKICDDFMFVFGCSFKPNQSFDAVHNIKNRGKPNQTRMASVPDLELDRGDLSKNQYKYGVRVDQLFTWKKKDRLIAQEFLDKRLTWRKNGKRSSQNEIIKASATAVDFGSVKLESLEIERLLSITLNNNTFVHQLIHCFSAENSLHRLKEKEFQALFYGFILTKDHEGNSIIRSNFENGGPLTILAFLNFLNDGISKAKQNGWLSTELFLTLLTAQIIYFIPEEHRDLAKIALKNLHQQMQDLVEQDLNPKTKNICHHWIVACAPLINQIQYLKDPLIQEILKLCEHSFNDLNLNYPPHDFGNLLMIKDFFNIGVSSFSKGKQIKGHFLPTWVFDHDDYKIIGDSDPEVKFIKPGIFELITKDKSKYQVRILKNKNIQILKKFSNQTGKETLFVYHREIDSSYHRKLQPLTKNIGYWVALKGPYEVLFVSSTDGSIKGRFVDNEIVHPQYPNLVLARCSAKPPLIQRIMKFGRLDYFLIWKDKQNHIIERIEIPSQNLTLSKSLSDTWHCVEYANMEVDFNASIPDLNPFAHYLVLKNEKEKKVLISNKYVKPEKTSFYKQPDLVNRKDSKIFVLSVNKNDKLNIPQEPEELLYLIHLALHSFKYSQALKLINHLQSLGKAWSDVAYSMVQSPWLDLADEDACDYSPYACALRIRLKLCAELSGPSKTEKPFDVEKLGEDYIRYMRTNCLGKEWWISPQNELLLIEMIKKESTVPFSTFRENQLNEIEETAPFRSIKSSIEDSKPNDFENLCDFQWVKGDVQTEMIRCYDKPMKIASYLRPGKEFVFNFLNFYKTAYENPNDKFLNDLVRFSRNTKNGQIELLRRILSNTIQLAQTKNGASKLIEPHQLLEMFQDTTGMEPNHKDLLRGMARDLNAVEDTWGLNYKFRNKQIRAIDLKPKSDVISFEDFSEPTSTNPPVLITTPPVTDYTKYLIDQELLIPADNQKAILEERNSLIQLQKACQYEPGTKSRVGEGIQERIQELENLLQTSCTTYTLPIAATAPSSKKDSTQQLADLQKFLADKAIESEDKANELEKEIIKLVNQRTKKTFGHSFAKIGSAKILTLNEVLLIIAKNDLQQLLQINSELKIFHLTMIKTLVIRYLIHKTDNQHLIRCQADLEKAIEVAKSEKHWTTKQTQRAVASFIRTMTQQRAYEPSKNVTVLAFEALSNIRLRQDQFDALQQLTEGQKSDFELEARTGFGKTKVLVPLWLLLTSKPGKITTFTTTASLLNDQVKYLRQILGQEAFKTAFQEVEFSKEQGSDPAYLQWLLQSLKEAEQKGGKIHLFKIDALHGLTGLALKDQVFKVGGSITTFNWLTSIRMAFQKGVHFIDESRECFNIRRTFDYANGKAKLIKTSHCLEAYSFFKAVVCSPSILSKWRFEFLSDKQLAGKLKGKSLPTAVLTEDNYDSEFLPDLVQAVIKYLKIPKDQKKAFVKYITGCDPKGAEAYFKTLSKRKQRRYAYCFHQVNGFLRKTLLKLCGVRYAAGNSGLAVPLDCGSFNPKNEFATTDDLINFTIQANLETPITSDLVREFVTNIQTDTQTLSYSAAMKKSNRQFFEKLNKTLTLSSIPKLNDQDIQTITDALNSPSEINLRLGFTAAHILPKITFLPYKISGNSFTLTQALGTIHAASGTVSPDTLPKRIKTLEKKSAIVPNLLALWKNSDREVLTLSSKNRLDFLSKLLSKRKTDRVLTDIGGVFRGLKQSEIIETIFKISKDENWSPPIKGVLFYNDNRKCMVWEEGAKDPIDQEKSHLEPADLFVYIRQSHAIGSDVPMPSDVRGTNTVSRETQLTLLLQGIGRMRGLSEDQIANFAIPEEDVQVIRTECNLDEDTPIQIQHLIMHAEKMEFRQKQKDYYFALKQQLRSSIEEQVWRARAKKIIAPAKELREVFLALKDVLLETTIFDHFDHLFIETRELDAREAVARLKSALFEQVQGLMKKNKILQKVIDLAEVEKDFDQFVNLDHLPATLEVGGASKEEMTSEVEAEKEVETEQEQQTNSDRSEFVPDEPVEWNGNYRMFLTLRPQTTILGIPVCYSKNLLHFQHKNIHLGVRKPANQYVLRIKPDESPRLLAMDIEDSAVAFTKMQSHQSERSEKNHFYLMSNQQIIATDGVSPFTTFEKAVEDTDLRLKLQIIMRVLSGSEAFSQPETDWILSELSEDNEDKESLVTVLQDTSRAWPKQEAMLRLLDEDTGITV